MASAHGPSWRSGPRKPAVRAMTRACWLDCGGLVQAGQQTGPLGPGPRQCLLLAQPGTGSRPGPVPSFGAGPVLAWEAIRASAIAEACWK